MNPLGTGLVCTPMNAGSSGSKFGVWAITCAIKSSAEFIFVFSSFAYTG